MIIKSKYDGYSRDGIRLYPIDMGGGGGGGGSAPKPMTRINESGPNVTDINRTTVNELPSYLTDASQDLIARGQALTSNPYEAYTGARVSEFSPLMNQAFGRMENQQVAGQLGEATGLASLAGQRAMQVGSGLGTYDPYEMGGFNAERAQQYMNPYMQSVVDVERRKAQEAANRQSAMLSGQAARQGAFGGSGAALQQRALTRDTAQQLADIQTQGMGRAYDQGLARFGAEEAMREKSREFGADYRLKGEQLGLEGLRTSLDSANVLSGLGQQQFAQEMDITKGMGTAGDIQRQREQALLDVDYQNYLTEQKYPYEQLAFQQGLVSGLPYSTTQRVSGQEVTQPGKTVTQETATPSTPDTASQLIGAGLTAYGLSEQNPYEGGAAKGGEVKGYAAGGITSLMDNVGSLSNDQLRQMQQTQQGPLTLAAVAEEVLNRQKVQADAAQRQAMMTPPPQTTVAEEALAGLPGLPAPNLEGMGDTYTAAGGGIVAFQNRGEVPAPYSGSFESLEPYRAGAYFRSGDKRIDPKTGNPITFGDFLRLQQAEKAAAAQPAAQKVIQQTLAPTVDTGIAQLIKPPTTRQGVPATAPTTKSVDRGGRDLAATPAEEAVAPSGLSALDAQLAAANKAREDAAREGVERVKKGQEEDGEYGTEREKRLKAQEAGLKGAKEENINRGFIRAGLVLMQGTTDRGTIANFAAAAGIGLDEYTKGLDKIKAETEKVDAAVARLEELRRTDRQVSRKELDAAQERVENAAVASADATYNWGVKKYDLSRDDKYRMQQLAIQRAAANKTSFEERMVMALGKGDMAAGYKALKAMDAKPADLMGEFNDYLKANPMMANAPQEEAIAAYMRSKMALSGLGAVPRASSTAAGPVRD